MNFYWTLKVPEDTENDIPNKHYPKEKTIPSQRCFERYFKQLESTQLTSYKNIFKTYTPTITFLQ
jgi:hypothetical protein